MTQTNIFFTNHLNQQNQNEQQNLNQQQNQGQHGLWWKILPVG